jgi:hypothetical protein
MYRWSWGKVCYAYLVDVPGSDVKVQNSAFCLSRWFTRGWTLQELIAPGTVYFCSKDWVKIGERIEHSEAVARITGIPRELLIDPLNLTKYSVAQKMSWASKRKTTRIEDVAYCLLGLVDVNMPLLYGEGDKAFLRLQEENMKITTDHTLFAWAGTDACLLNGSMDGGLLALSPEYFVESSRFVREETRVGRSLKPYSMTNRGLEIELSLCRPQAMGGPRLAILNCASLDFPAKYISIYLTTRADIEDFYIQSATLFGDNFMRTLYHKLEFLECNNVVSSLQMIYIQRGGINFIRQVD